MGRIHISETAKDGCRWGVWSERQACTCPRDPAAGTELKVQIVENGEHQLREKAWDHVAKQDRRQALGLELFT